MVGNNKGSEKYNKISATPIFEFCLPEKSDPQCIYSQCSAL